MKNEIQRGQRKCVRLLRLRTKKADVRKQM